MAQEDTLAGFLGATGTIEILLELGDGQRTFEYLRNNVEISSSTLSNRLKGGVQFGVWEQTLRYNDKDGTSRKVYQLTDDGEEYYEQALEYDLPTLFKEFYQVKFELEATCKEYIGDVTSESP